jgi:branched-chain amino acid transport system permease protein
MLHVAQIISYGLLSGALYGLVALGLSLVFGVMNYLMIAHGGLIMLAAYATYWAYSYTHIDPFLLIIVVTPLFFVLGWVLFKVLYQSLMKFPEGEKIKNSMLISFGLLLIFSNLATLLWTADERSVTTFYTGGVIQVLGVRLPYIGLGGVVLAVAVIIALHLFLSRTYFGKAIRAVSMDHEAATLVGIDVRPGRDSRRHYLYARLQPVGFL